MLYLYDVEELMPVNATVTIHIIEFEIPAQLVLHLPSHHQTESSHILYKVYVAVLQKQVGQNINQLLYIAVWLIFNYFHTFKEKNHWRRPLHFNFQILSVWNKVCHRVISRDCPNNINNLTDNPIVEIIQRDDLLWAEGGLNIAMTLFMLLDNLNKHDPGFISM